MDDRNFIDLVTSNVKIKIDPYFNSKEYYQKFSEMESNKNNELMYNYQQFVYVDQKKSSKKK